MWWEGDVACGHVQEQESIEREATPSSGRAVAISHGLEPQFGHLQRSLLLPLPPPHLLLHHCHTLVELLLIAVEDTLSGGGVGSGGRDGRRA